MVSEVASAVTARQSRSTPARARSRRFTASRSDPQCCRHDSTVPKEMSAAGEGSGAASRASGGATGAAGCAPAGAGATGWPLPAGAGAGRESTGDGPAAGLPTPVGGGPCGARGPSRGPALQPGDARFEVGHLCRRRHRVTHQAHHAELHLKPGVDRLAQLELGRLEDLESAQPESLGSHPRQGRGQLSILVPDVGALSVAEGGELCGAGEP